MAYASTPVLAARQRRLRSSLQAQGVDALVITHLPNIFYLTNFVGTAAIVIATADRLHFITDFRYVAAFTDALSTDAACPDANLVRVSGAYDETLAATIEALGVGRLGIEGGHFTVARYRWLAERLAIATPWAADAPAVTGRRLIPLGGVVEELRLVKDAHEIDTLRTAGRMLSGVVEGILAEVRKGRTEREIAATIDWRLVTAGFQRPAFDTIVAAGPNAALPHARPGTRVLSPGDLVVLDFGGVYDGYCVDLSRTVSIGTPGAEARRVWEAVAEAQQAALERVTPGVAAGDIDAAARDVLKRHGLGDAFGHSTGHGLGIEIHEEPRIGERKSRPGVADPADAPVVPGMVFTVEPGAYLPGWGGVRLEDDVLVTVSGRELLTNVPRQCLAL